MDEEGRGLRLRAWHKAALHAAAIAAPVPGVYIHLELERTVAGVPPGDFIVLALLVAVAAIALLAFHRPKSLADKLGLAFLALWGIAVALAAYASCWESGFGGEECYALGG